MNRNEYCIHIYLTRKQEGLPDDDISRELGISRPTLYNLRKKYGLLK